ncbi:MAG: hypothetical protein EXR67_03085 [Dehalococcoidia bacterium]|nr:hypothetical protein [Dehalococcoidia bacterium]
MTLWKNPTKRVWYSVVCPNCHRQTARIKHPGLMRKTTLRLCQNCTSKQPVAQTASQPAPAQAPAPAPAREGRRQG